ncbi:uncharacterized protein L203_104339 [Cryptococcus depauperatus CBS 7841]|uniref:Uncharacterized protein n=1 Tax=Cryptococcus depauperatus CBS 7841 TaxID=1295531 RepID=A0A1E3IHT3_9TREE|nr:hypothetical protein L203_03273 [Cryptococcus depauperatus CBS 7841]
MPSLVLLLTLASFFQHVFADHKLDLSRMGPFYSSMPLYRGGAGTNVLTVGVGSPKTVVNLTCSTNVEFFMVATSGCHDCVKDSDSYSVSGSSSVTTSQQALVHTFYYPIGKSNTLTLAGQLAQEILTDERNDGSTTRPIALVTRVQTNDPNGKVDGSDVTLTDGTSGFWGLGVYQPKKTSSLIGSMINVNGNGAPSSEVSFTVGFDIKNYTRSPGDAGTVHWGGVPNGSWTGDFNWMSTNRSIGGSWGFEMDRMRVSDEVIDLEHLYGTIDPAFDAIYVPTAVAEKFFSKVSGAERDLVDTTRWNLPCDTNITSTISISGSSYAISSSELVQKRDLAGRSCWGSVVAWQNGSAPELRGEVRLGTPFMSNIYAVLYYTENQQYVGLAGKPNSVNAHNLLSNSKSGHRNGQLAGILIGSLVGVLVLLLLICYTRNRNSFQSIWFRAIRRQQRAQMNMVIRGATLPPIPPPMMPIGMGGPMMGPGIIGPRGPMGPMGPMAPMPMGGPPSMMPMMGGGIGGYQPVPPPAYQAPVSHKPQQEQSQPLLANNSQYQGNQQYQKMPETSGEKPQGYYSPRLQQTPPRSTLFPFIPRSAKASASHGHPPMQQGNLYTNQPLLNESRVHFGPAGARAVRSTSSISEGKPVTEFGGFDPRSGPQGRNHRREEYLEHYAADNRMDAQQGYAPYPGVLASAQSNLARQNISQTHAQMYPTVPGNTEGHYTPSQTSEKKRYFIWRPGGETGKSPYRAVSAAGSEDGGQKPKSWFGGRSGGWKEAERGRERERFEVGWTH